MAGQKHAHRQIALSDIVIVMVGQDTHNAPGVEKEVTVERLISLTEADISGAIRRDERQGRRSAERVKWFRGNGSGLTRRLPKNCQNEAFMAPPVVPA